MGLRLFFLPNFPGAMFIQVATFIPDSRVTDFFLLSKMAQVIDKSYFLMLMLLK